MIEPFVAIDFETATDARDSACAVGLVRIDENGEIAGRYYRLIKPHGGVSQFGQIQTWTHGLAADDVAGSPEWNEIENEVFAFVDGLPLVAHNMGFDGAVLTQIADRYHLEMPPNPRFCTMRMARRFLRGQLPGFRLESVYSHYFPGEQFNHHQADEDALAAARVFVALQNEFGFRELANACPAQKDLRKSKRKSPHEPGRKKTLQEMKVAKENLDALVSASRASQPLLGERVAVTGTLNIGTRTDVKQAVVTLGGIAEKSFTQGTTLLVVGIPNRASWSEGADSSKKFARATEMRANGSTIEIISEDEFLSRLHENEV